jgi:hypothetical protein
MKFKDESLNKIDLRKFAEGYHSSLWHKWMHIVSNKYIDNTSN